VIERGGRVCGKGRKEIWGAFGEKGGKRDGRECWESGERREEKRGEK
jgi:hypothetical protein